MPRRKKATSSPPGIVLTASRLVWWAIWRTLKRMLPTWRAFFARLRARIPEEARKRHTYIVGKTGSGKSELLKLFLHGDRRKGKSTSILIDPHGDLAEEVARFKEHERSDDLIYIDPYLDKYGKKKPCINPLEIKDKSPQNVDFVSQSLVSAFKELLQNTSLTTQMEALLIPCLTVLLKREGSTLLDLQRFMNDERNEDLVEEGKQSDIVTHRNFFQYRFYEKTFAITKASLSTKLQSILNSQTFYYLTVGNSTLDMESVLDSRKLIIFNLSKGQLGRDTSEAFGRFIIASIQSAILKRAQQATRNRVPVHLYIDEFHNYVSPSLEEILAESRKYGLHLTLAQQFIGQNMDTQFQKTVLSLTEIKITGTCADDNLSKTATAMGMEETEIARLGTGSFFVKVSNRPPFRLYAPTFLLGNNNGMTWEGWHGVREHQLDQYYRNIGLDMASQTKTNGETGDARGSDPDEYQNDATPQEPKKKPKKPKFQL